jgi:hypothetical protein
MKSEIRWRELESRIALDRLPEFHRAFLKLRGVHDPEEMMLRRVQQGVERELNTLIQSGEARREGEEVFISKSALEGLDLDQWTGAL